VPAGRATQRWITPGARLKKTIDDALETIRKQLNGPLPVAASFGGGAGAGGTAGGLIDIVLDGYEVLQLMKVWDDEWFEVRNDAFAVATRLKDPEKRLEAHWKGPAALKYYQILGPQVTAARRVGELADMIGKTLQTVAGAANTFYYALAVALTAILGAIIGAIVAVFGVISALAAVPLVVGALTASAAIIYGFMSFNDTLAAEASKLLAEVGDTTGFDKGPILAAGGRIVDGCEPPRRIGRLGSRHQPMSRPTPATSGWTDCLPSAAIASSRRQSWKRYWRASGAAIDTMGRQLHDARHAGPARVAKQARGVGRAWSNLGT
jgi:hypothetical protein